MRENIYEMRLHQTIYLEEERCSIMRAASGWIYKLYTTEYDNLGYEHLKYLTTIFVPFDDRFTVALR